MKICAVIADTGITRTRGVVADDKADRARFMIQSFRRAGAEEIVIVTPPGDKSLRRRLAPLDVTFIEPDVREGEMFDYVKEGLAYFSGKCGRVFLTPLHIPFFSPDTLLLLQKCGERIVVPSLDGRGGHPILIDADLIPSILSYGGRGGLRGAVHALGVPVFYLATEDPGVRMDTGNVEEYLEIRDRYSADDLHVEAVTRILRGKAFFDGQCASLLRQIDRLGSVKEAARRNGISYSKAWNLIRACETAAGREVVVRLHGGKYGGEASVTEFGKELVSAYERLDREVQEFAEKRFGDLLRVWKD